MKVNAWKNIDVEVEVDVTIDDCLNELFDIANSEDGTRRKTLALDSITKIMEKIGPDVLTEKQLESVLPELTRRLQKWIDVLTAKG